MHQLRRSTRRGARLLATAGLATGLTLGTLAAVPAQAQSNPYQKGPDPTAQSIVAKKGPFATAEANIRNYSGFNGGKVYYPTDATQTYGAVVIVPGFLASWGPMSWLGPRIASQGFVVVGIDTNSGWDQPGSRATQLRKALDWALSKNNPAVDRIDPNRLALSGWSMGGGGAIQASSQRGGIKATIAITPWHTQKRWTNAAPTFIFGAQNDLIAPHENHAKPLYQQLTAPEKQYVEFKGADHFFTNSANDPQAAMMISWLKRWVDDDTRYDQFLCPKPAVTNTSEVFTTCPN